MAGKVWLIPLIDTLRRTYAPGPPADGDFEAWVDAQLAARGYAHGLLTDVLVAVHHEASFDAPFDTYGLMNHTAHLIQMAIAARGGPRDVISDQTELMGLLAHIVERPKATSRARRLGAQTDPESRGFVKGLNGLAADVGEALSDRAVSGEHPLFGHPFHQLLRAVQARRFVRLAQIGIDGESTDRDRIDGLARSTLHRAISAAIALAVADGIVDPPEAALIDALMKAARLDPAEMAMHRAEFGDPADPEALAAELSDPFTRRFVMRLLFLAAHINGRYHESERRLIERMAVAAGESAAAIDAYEAEALAAYEQRPDFIDRLSLGAAVGRLRRDLGGRIERVITLNSRRLWAEVRETGELMQLLAVASQRPLTDEEEAAMRAQFIDICKAVPALALFAVPGGSILMPLLLKHLPIDLRPSNFVDEARVEADEPTAP